jgi:hypothetical protein
VAGTGLSLVIRYIKGYEDAEEDNSNKSEFLKQETNNLRVNDEGKLLSERPLASKSHELARIASKVSVTRYQEFNDFYETAVSQPSAVCCAFGISVAIQAAFTCWRRLDER